MVSTMPTTFVATWSATTSFNVPDNVLLFLHDKPNGSWCVGRWYIFRNELIYLDKDLKLRKIQGSEPELDFKPESVEFQED